MLIGPVTDYGSTLAHWMRNREPRFKGGFKGEAERPSASYIVDVSSMFQDFELGIINPWLDATTLSKSY